jgi:hypothetical protein
LLKLRTFFAILKKGRIKVCCTTSFYAPLSGGLMATKKDSRLKNAGVSGYNKPKRTPKHPTKSHGQQGKTGDKTMTPRAKSFKARHAKNIAKGKMSAAYWANKVKW